VRVAVGARVLSNGRARPPYETLTRNQVSVLTVYKWRVVCHCHQSAVARSPREVVPPWGAMMRKLVSLALGSTAIVALACGKSKSNATAVNDDLKRDLQLATQSQAIQISPDEISPRSHQEMAVRPKKAPDGPRTIRSEHPTRMASATPVEAAEIKTQLPPAQVMASTATSPSPSATPSPDAPPLARPSPLPAPTYPSAAPIGENGGTGVGAVLGGIFGAVIRGGIVGDDDHCDPRHPPRAGGPIGGSARPPTGIGRAPIFPGNGRRF
jgi:hypothetical protein